MWFIGYIIFRMVAHGVLFANDDQEYYIVLMRSGLQRLLEVPSGNG
jgi:hypothetical protein